MRNVSRSIINEWLLVYLSSLMPPTSCDCSGCTVDGDEDNGAYFH